MLSSHLHFILFLNWKKIVFGKLKKNVEKVFRLVQFYYGDFLRQIVIVSHY